MIAKGTKEFYEATRQIVRECGLQADYASILSNGLQFVGAASEEDDPDHPFW